MARPAAATAVPPLTMRPLLTGVAAGALVFLALGTGWALYDRLIPRLRRH